MTPNLKGQRFGRLRVLNRDRTNVRYIKWRCICDCGGRKSVRSDHLRTGRSKSCGCYSIELNIKRRYVHGESGRRTLSREYRAWRDAINRCSNPNVAGFKYYGARGIRVCDKWRASYVAFLADMGRCPSGRSLDRENNDGNYEPGNCRWATPKEQSNNRRKRGTAVPSEWTKR